VKCHLTDGGRDYVEPALEPVVFSLVDDEGKPAYNTSLGQVQDEPLDAVWVTINAPDPAVPTGLTSVFAQGTAKGGAAFARLEGAWYGRGKIFFTSTNGGNAGQGQVWEYEPSSETLRLVFESPASEVLNSPDNITVSPRGGLVLCEDGGGSEFLHGLTVDGEIFRFAQNNVVLNGERNAIIGDFRGSEFAGATYSPDGKWLFCNIQTPGITFAVTGPGATARCERIGGGRPGPLPRSTDYLRPKVSTARPAM